MTFQKRLNIVALNQRGVMSIRRCSYDRAISEFTHALTILRDLHEDEAEKGHRQPSAVEAQIEYETEIIMIDEQTKESSAWSPSEGIHQDLDFSAHLKNPSFGYVYQDPINISMESSTLVQAYIIAVMFNLALAFHLHGLQQLHHQQQQHRAASRNGHGLENALRLYELCYEMLASERINPGLCFIMVLANNLGHVHTMFRSYDKARQCFEHLLSILVYRMDCNDTIDTTEFTQATWEGFVCNTSSLVLKDCCASAA